MAVDLACAEMALKGDAELLQFQLQLLVLLVATLGLTRRHNLQILGLFVDDPYGGQASLTLNSTTQRFVY